MTQPQKQTIDVYVCSGKGGSANPPPNAGGIQLYHLSLLDGELTPSLFISDPRNVGYLAPHPDGRHLYGLHGLREIEGQPGGGASAYAIDEQSGGLNPLNLKSVHGLWPCYTIFDPSSRWLIVVNYGAGNVVVLPILDDGTLGDATDIIQHLGSSVSPQRQEGPHTHSVILDPTNRYVLVADLGIDKIVIYRLDSTHDSLKLHAEGSLSTRPGSGPRHLAYHPNGRYLYCTNELNSTLTAFAGDVTRGTLHEIQTVPTLPPGFGRINSPAHLQFAPSGTYLYVSNRGHDSIAIFEVDAATGLLQLKSHASTQGNIPRHFAVDPTGRYLLAANEKSGNMATFKIDTTTGELSLIAVTEVPMPVFVLFRPR